MGRAKKNKPRRTPNQPHHASQHQRTQAASTQIAWTPLKQACGCVVDWGWASDTADPMTFMDWVVSRLTVPCPWHATPEAGVSGADLPHELIVQPRGTDVLLHARKASGPHVELGAELADRLDRVLDKARQGDSVLLDDAPTGFRSWLIASTPHPAQAWLEHELTEIILNQGRSTLPRELLERLPEQLLSPPARPQPDSAACNVCSFSAATGGLLCTCGHDWSCHPGDVALGEPCSHCACPDMQHT
ncbi:hypothetical protein [Streptomyces sp. NPDC054765]